MHGLTPQYADRLVGTWSGFARLIFRGTLRRRSVIEGRPVSRSARHGRRPDWSAHARAGSARSKAAGRAGPVSRFRCHEESGGRPPIARERGIIAGPVCRLPGGEPFVGFAIPRAPGRRRYRQGRPSSGDPRDPAGGFLNGRRRCWFPFDLPLGLNGREWRARQSDPAGRASVRPDPGFRAGAAFAQAPALRAAPWRTAGPVLGDRRAAPVHPLRAERCGDRCPGYSGSACQSARATFVSFVSFVFFVDQFGKRHSPAPRDSNG
jgi:hypothetical protein